MPSKNTLICKTRVTYDLVEEEIRMSLDTWVIRKLRPYKS